jgi:hypothetical protein
MDTSNPTLAELVLGASKAMRSLHDAAAALSGSAPPIDQEELANRGHFRPLEEGPLLAWFARFLTIRESLWEVITEVSDPFDGNPRNIGQGDELRCFVLGYGAACNVVAMDRFLVDDFATHSLIQRKLNEGSSEHRIPRKQFTASYKSLSSARNALWMLGAMRTMRGRRSEVEGLIDDPMVGFLVVELPSLEGTLDRSKRRFLRLLFKYRKHSSRRRGASAKQRTLATGLEASGRMVSELRNRWREKSVSPVVYAQLSSLLQPGDVLVTRHAQALTNLFLPGFWPHVALYVGSPEDRQRLAIHLEPEQEAKWRGQRRTLEARKDGVLFRRLEETLGVDAVAVIRPRLSLAEIAEGITRAATHEGKLYNFDFDFFRTDRLVCTEVVYRAYDGLGDLRFQLQERAGRPTLAAEDLLDLALEGRFFEPIALFAPEAGVIELLTGPEVSSALAASYESQSDSQSK